MNQSRNRSLGSVYKIVSCESHNVNRPESSVQGISCTLIEPNLINGVLGGDYKAFVRQGDVTSFGLSKTLISVSPYF